MKDMRFIGITGGVGAGKSEILSHLTAKPGVRVMLADEIAHKLMQPGTDCFKKLKSIFGEEDIYCKDGSFDRNKLAAVIFSDEDKREKLNGIVHPAVKEYVCKEAALERKKSEISVLFIEAALLIEEHYDEICDEIWYIYTDKEIRRARLKSARGYTDEKIDMIYKSQLDDCVYRRYCKTVIDNNGSLAEAFAQIDEALRR